MIWGVSYKEPAHAAGVVVEVAIDVAIATGLAVLGVGVAGTVSNQDYKSNILEKMKTSAVMQTVTGVTATMVAGHAVYNFTKDFLSALGNQFMTVYNAWQQASAINLPNTSGDNVSLSASTLFNTLGFNVKPITGGYATDVGNINSYRILGTLGPVQSTTVSWSAGNVYIMAYRSSGGSIYFKIPAYNGNFNSVSFQIMSGAVFGYILSYTVKNSNGVYYALISPANASLGGASGATNWFTFGSDSISIGDTPGLDVWDGVGGVYADGVSILNNPVADVVGRVGNSVGTKNDAGEVVGVPANVKDGADTSIDKTRDVSQESVIGKDIATDADRDKDNTTNKDKDTTPPKVGDIPDLSLPEVIFKEKFPFCLPWDIYTAFSNLVAPAQPPKWQVPFKIKSLSYSQDISIDFSQFNMLSSILRWGLSIAFVIWLILLTRRIIGQ